MVRKVLAESAMMVFAGWQTIGRKYSMLNASGYMSIMDEARLNSGMSPVDWASLSSIHDARGIYMILIGLTRLLKMAD